MPRFRKGEKLDDAGFAVIPLATNNPTGGPESEALNFKLDYDTGTSERGSTQSVSEGMIMTKTNPPDSQIYGGGKLQRADAQVAAAGTPRRVVDGGSRFLKRTPGEG